jgi:hypothetical protein
MREHKEKYTCFLFGEGADDIRFIMRLVDLKKFKFHTSKWFFNNDHASGHSPSDIASQCKKLASDRDYDLILCFIDRDKLKHDFPETWEDERLKLEQKYPKVKFIWQIENIEDEFKKVYGIRKISKFKLNIWARKNIEKFVNSDYWNYIKKIVKDREIVLDQEKRRQSSSD